MSEYNAWFDSDSSVIRLGTEEWITLHTMLEYPPPPTSGLVELFMKKGDKMSDAERARLDAAHAAWVAEFPKRVEAMRILLSYAEDADLPTPETEDY